MNTRLIINIVSILVVLTGIALLFTTFIGWLMGDSASVILTFLASALFIICVGGGSFLKTRQKDFEVGFRDGFAIVAYGWVVIAIFGAIPFYFVLPYFSLADAFFEMMSGFTTTGASVLTDVESVPYAINFWRHFSNWLGGMGVVLLSLAIFPMLGIGGMQLYNAEVPNPTSNQLTSRIASTAKILWIIYLILSVTLAIILYSLDMSGFDAICHAMSTMATGGFSTKNASIGHFSIAIQYTISFFMLLAGINFVLHLRAFQGKIKNYFIDEECRIYLLITIITTAIVTFILVQQTGYDLEKAFRCAIFQVISILTTTGFGNDNFASWVAGGSGLILMLYFIGGSGGSTSGGIKVTRIMHLLKNAKEELKCAIFPHYLSNVKMDGRRVKQNTIKRLSNFFFLYLAIFFIIGLIMCTVDGMDLETAFSSSIACLGNVGPGIGKVNQISNYAFLPSYAKIVLAIAMVIGRLEVYTILVLFLPKFWKNK